MAEEILRLLVVHSSAELYGSDRSLLDFVRHTAPNIRVTVALPERGVLVQALEAVGATVIIGEVCKIQRSMFSPLGFFTMTKTMLRSVRFLGTARDNHGFDLVYSNTIAVLGGALSARLWGVPHVWHVREILSSSSVLTPVFRRLVAWLSSSVVCNSGQTLDWIKLKGKAAKYQVVWNGFDVPNVEADRLADRASLGAGEDDLLFVLVGRINRWKGQKLLVQAFSQLVSNTKLQVKLAIVGSAPAGQEHYETELAAFVAKSGCADRVILVPYRVDIEPIWIAADVVVVPSTEPEPFGRVAIEAMGFGKPVIAAAHGGLVEIVVDGTTGMLVKPSDPLALTNAMLIMLQDAELRKQMGEAGRLRQRDLFSVAGYASQLTQVLRKTVATSQKTVLFVHRQPK